MRFMIFHSGYYQANQTNNNAKSLHGLWITRRRKFLSINNKLSILTLLNKPCQLLPSLVRLRKFLKRRSDWCMELSAYLIHISTREMFVLESNLSSNKTVFFFLMKTNNIRLRNTVSGSFLAQKMLYLPLLGALFSPLQPKNSFWGAYWFT